MRAGYNYSSISGCVACFLNLPENDPKPFFRLYPATRFPVPPKAGYDILFDYEDYLPPMLNVQQESSEHVHTIVVETVGNMSLSDVFHYNCSQLTFTYPEKKMSSPFRQCVGVAYHSNAL